MSIQRAWQLQQPPGESWRWTEHKKGTGTTMECSKLAFDLQNQTWPALLIKEQLFSYHFTDCK